MAQKDDLFRILDQKVFEPVLSIDTKQFGGKEKQMLQDLQESTRSHKQRFHNYDSAREVYERYHDDLASSTGKDKSRQARKLGLPTLADVHDEFDRAAKEMNVV